MTDESTRFLRGLYTAILTELIKVTLNNDLETLDRAEAYIARLKDIWEKDVMAKEEGSRPETVNKPAPKQFFQPALNASSPKTAFHAISV